MPLDLDLQELRRAVTAEPESPVAWLALAHGLARAGASGDAVEGYYRARAIGAERRACSEGLVALGARPSPWTHVTGDSERTFSAPVRGPRRGVVVAREGGSRPRVPQVVLEESSQIVVCTGNEVERLQGRRLARAAIPTKTIGTPGTRLVPTVASSGVVHVASGPSFTRLLRDDEPRLGIELPGIPWLGGGAAVTGAKIVLGVFHVPQNQFFVFFHDERLAHERLFEVDCDRWSQWAVSADGIAVIADEEIRGFQHDGSERFRRPCARSIDGLLLVGSRTVWSELRPSDARTKTRWVQLLDEKGDYVWGKNVEEEESAGRLARSPDGTLHVVSADGLVRFTSDGRELKRGPGCVPGSDVVVDREGVAYFEGESEPGGHGSPTTGLVAVGPDGERLFFVPEELSPVAIDSFGRLLALTEEHTLVAIE